MNDERLITDLLLKLEPDIIRALTTLVEETQDISNPERSIRLKEGFEAIYGNLIENVVLTEGGPW